MGKRLKVEDYIGRKFNRLTVLKEDGLIDGLVSCSFKCDCGTTIIRPLTFVKRGRIKSCGCLKDDARDKAHINSVVHGKSHTRLYRIWCHIKARCTNPNDDNYMHYGGRGISVCEEWFNDFNTFHRWATTEGGYKEDLTIERVNVNGNYEPSNCIFADTAVQSRNRRNNRKVRIGDKEMVLTDWCSQYNISMSAVKYRVKQGMSIEEALTTPKGRRVNRGVQ